ncbi:MAG TPA: hypothetical protein VG936_12760 [Lacunisphaera sp.]|nr:hypothetical protein [Lacunisphaera sp.]
MPAPLICLITPGHLASTPRLLKEADALVAAGYRVHVVAGRHYEPVDPLDQEVLAAAPWACTRIDYRGGAGAFVRKLGRRAARLLLGRTRRGGVRLAAVAHHAETLRLARAAAIVPADLYLGHCLAGLAAAALAAGARPAACGFDAEDFHDAETEAAVADPADMAAARILHARLLPRCRHFTAASPLIARHYREAYGVDATVVLNVFPLAQAPATPVAPGPITLQRPARIYWFSQTVGPGRGLEAVVAVLARMQTPVELELRGFASPDYVARLNTLARREGLARPVRFLVPGPAAAMARLAAGADLGLSTEESTPLNRDLCLTNKIFVYLLAGVPQLLSPTSAQQALAPELGPAALLADLGQPEATARELDAFFADPPRVQAARTHAWQLAKSKFCWDVEREKFLASVRGVAVPCA